MKKMSSQLETIINAYKTLAKIPSIVEGRVNRNGTRITSKWSVRNLEKGKMAKYLYSYTLDKDLKVVGKGDFGVDVSNEILSAVSKLESYKAIIREGTEKDIKKHYLEIWQQNMLAHCIDLTALDIHGDVYADSEFGSLDWSPDEQCLVYIAEKKIKKSEPYIKRKSVESKKPDAQGDEVIKGEEYVYRQDWGEQLVGKKMSVIVLVRLPEETVTVLEGLPESWCPGQVSFAPDGKSVVGVAWETEPRRLGLIFCTNRPSYIFQLTLDGKRSKLSGEGLAVRSPRWEADGEHLLWLQRAAGGPHHACHALVRRDNTNTISKVIDIVETDIKISKDEIFYGLYNQGLPKRCFSRDGYRLVFSTPQQNEVKSYVVDLENNEITDISRKTAPGSTTVLDVYDDVVLAVFSSMTHPPQLCVARLPVPGRESTIVWCDVSDVPTVPPSIQNSKIKYLHFTHEESLDKIKSFSALYMAPEGDEKCPLVVWPHGGPHSGFVNSFGLEAALFNMLGFAVLQVNYRGSTGFGDATVNFLTKRIGTSDVFDCKYATDLVLNKFLVDKTKVVLMGGSHGGFLVTHLSGQYPDMYKAVVARNPVTDVASMFSTTDIADWCAVEAGYVFTEKGEISDEQLLFMRRISPIVHVHKVKAPTALMLGSGDKRVPAFQGLDYSRRLKANGVETKVYMYDDNHSLSSVPNEMDNLINGVSWFLEHISKLPTAINSGTSDFEQVFHNV